MIFYENLKTKHILRIGAGIAGLLITSVQLLYAGSVKSQTIDEVEITIELRHVSLVQAFSKIEAQSPFHFMYRDEDIKNIRNLNLAPGKHTVAECLKLLLANTSLIFRQIDNHILVKRESQRPPAAASALNTVVTTYDREIKGKVTNAHGEPLGGVSITLKGSAIGTATDAEGRFSINVPENGVLVFSFVGFKTLEAPVKGRNSFNVTLEDQTQSLNEAVVTALGIRKEKKALTYAVTEINGSEFTQARENNLGNALSGKIAGVNATSTATGPGGSSRVIIRGNGSLSGDNQPLYIVNGVPINNAVQGTAPGTYGGIDRGDGLVSINPDDIETISVLKGGTAAALYGSRAANGVILITTKSGRAQKGVGVEYSSTYTQENPLDIPDWQYEYGSGSRGAKPTSQSEAIANGRISWGAKLDGTPVVNPDGVSRPYSAQKNNIRNFYHNGTTFSNTLAMTGGNENINFRFSVSNMENKGIVPNSSLNRKTFNLSVSANLAKKLIFEGRAQYNIEQNHNRTYIADFSKNPNAAVGLVATNIDVRTLAPGYDAQGYETPWSDYVFVVNPYFATSKVKNQDERRRFIGSFSTRYNITDFLYARARVGIDYFNINASDIEPTGLLYNPDGSMTTSRSTTWETNAEALLGFDRKFRHFTVNAIAGGNQMHNKLTGIDISSGLFNVPFTYFVTNGKNPVFTESYRESAINSLFASADVAYNSYLFLNLTGRKDWFSTLATGSNNLFYPSAGLSFIFSDIWKSRPSWLNYGKVRGSWAQVGGGAPDPYGLSLAYVAPSSSHLGQPLMNISGNTIPNSALEPYTSTTVELGVELRALNSRVGADITLYDRTTTNDIVSASVPLSSSYTSVLLNVGKMRNKGIELLLTGSPVRSLNGLNWDVSFNMAYNDNKVIKIADGLTSLALPGAEARTENGFVYHYENMPFGMISGYKARQDLKGNTVYSKDNGLPIQSDFMALGRGVPPLTLGLSNTFGYKQFTLGFLVDAKFGAKMYTSTNAYGTYYGLDKRTVDGNVRENGVAVKGVDEDGNAFSQTLAAQDYYQGIAFSLTDQFVSDAGFIKLRQLTLGYNFPRTLLAKTPFQSASLSLVARNLLLLYSQVKNVDPESNYNTSNGQGLENFGVPPTRSYGLNLMVKF
jgi:TonB-linked SusC/RagA family outer membrane protein